jgi:alpha-glucosidase (family GH31 glycosyl hydrolase)
MPGFLVLLGLFFFVRAEAAAANDDSSLAWGVSAMTLKPVLSSAPSWDELLTNDAECVSLNDFYRAGGAGVARAPTECRIAYTPDSLLIAFRCRETNMSFPAMSHGTNWNTYLDSPPDQDSTFPDKVEVYIRPDPNKPYYYQFAAALDGSQFGCKWRLRSRFYVDEDDDSSPRVSILKTFDATVTRGTNEWRVFLRIPWQTLGGRPKDYFGFLPVRTRWRDGEVSSPVAFDFGERPPMDLFIETHWAGGAPVQIYPGSLCPLPSGALRWQRPALLVYPDTETVHRIWQMEQSLDEPTSNNNFAERLFLTQRWTDLLTLEGFNFRLGRGSIVETNLLPSTLRQKINGALLQEKMSSAYKLLDGYLAQLDKVSRKWFADGSPGDIGAWSPVSKVESVEREGKVLTLHCLAGSQPVDLHLSFPKAGGVRIYGSDEGYFKPDSLMPLNLIQSANFCSIATRGGKAVVRYDPFSILFFNGVGKPATGIGPDDLAFRFDASGKIAAVDFRSRLDADEVVYGFGEKYDRFDENGNVLTLWGMDDWSGNAVGLMNQTYKPIALFHSSKGYTVFDNSTYRLRTDIGRTNPQQYRLTQQGPVFDYYVWTGSPEKAISSYTSLTGKPILPPKWAFEPWMGRTGRGWNAPSHNPVAEEENVTKRFAALDIPHSAIYSEGAGADSTNLNRFMAARGIKVLSWFWPVISEKEQARLLPEINTNELPVLNAGNKRATAELGYVDFTNPNALDLFRQWWRRRLDIGVAGSMVDFGDRVTPDAVFYDGRRGDEMHNFYAYDYHRTCNEVFREKRGDDFILFGRAAAPGDQRWVAQFAGDHPSNFIGLQSVLTGALNLCACGFSTWGSDLGGFLGWPEPAVFERWTQFGCFSPLMRCHGRTPREPWNYGAAAVANYKYFAWVRENLLDYIYNAAANAHATGIPIMRSMAVAFPDDAVAAAADGQYMFGPDLLVAPVVTENNVKDIFFPSGQWTSLWTGETISGPTNIAITVPLDSIPVYLKPSAIVPVALNDSLQFGQSMTGGNVKALVVTPPDAVEEVQFQYDAAPITPDIPATKTPDATVALHPQANGFVVTLSRFETSYLLVYGVSVASSVKVNGDDLLEVAGQLSSVSGGWQVDPAVKRLVIKLPKDQGLPNTAANKIEISLGPETNGGQ